MLFKIGAISAFIVRENPYDKRIKRRSDWIAHIGTDCDFGGKFVLDAMIGRVTKGGLRIALDVGCIEGRFRRMLGAFGIKTGNRTDRSSDSA
ncbi:hypothetical protein IVB30_32740 [Bradyrhizobium sp. 200]|uniref:hypothetical protein n=1 Tax=Bradyrhizobium sp. 200 TaxID=2782665 RepID=UPI00200004CD|nr:hypothetical protein [Bradyrhizobium sp. 200]UPJ47909.1 hypothetical protein IVB30_32740 [Bradyrhizobium sp. 200]